jgi:hypothetical protein
MAGEARADPAPMSAAGSSVRPTAAERRRHVRETSDELCLSRSG